MENNLPKNWVQTSIGNVSEIIRGVSYKKDQAFSDSNANSVYILRGGNIQDEKLDFETDDNVFVDKTLINENQFVKKYDVVIVGSTGSKKLIGKAGIAEQDFDSVAFGAFLMLLRTRKIDKKFHSYFFQTKYYRNLIAELAGGVNINNIRKEYLENMKFPLPPLPEQERIVAKLDALFAQHETIKKSLDKIPQLLKDFRQQVLTQAVTGKLTEKWREGKDLEEWREEKLKNIIKVKSGNSLSANQREVGAIPVFGGNGITGYHNKANIFQETIVIGRVGFYCGSIHLTSELAWVTDNALIVDNLMDNNIKFLFFLLKYLKLGTYNNSTAQPVISGSKIYDIEARVPSIIEQQEIVSRIESLFAKADAIESRYQKLKKKVEQLPQVILHKAFKGELVPQLPTDGDAKDLLKEIMELKKAGVKK
ncbi:restriction endonuclease subunit S [Chryseobacterium koreense]|uniref:Type I restriction modification DNA specificity domain-containing protein n=1 Tax=Chryseobacterium koreense CCUG 49689 TaxID=1304281 RepID=A0A0J7IX12_9FLAO|nr:restriction endonuclease subunit S [Chryseobacterium koreense]KMQ70823.1 hypothetical protein ACM44_09295 [Chryseobacterium koreense CCUG 49689]MBB5332539.1 type I restriction enzyme S subunit [Chryseobacterium koreense]